MIQINRRFSITGSYNTYEKNKTKVISPKLTHNIYCIPGCPVNIDIKNVSDLYILKQLECEYEHFMEKRYQILLLLNMMEQVFEIRDLITMRINLLERHNKMKCYEITNEY